MTTLIWVQTSKVSRLYLVIMVVTATVGKRVEVYVIAF
jgi:hypothetical protein